MSMIPDPSLRQPEVGRRRFLEASAAALLGWNLAATPVREIRAGDDITGRTQGRPRPPVVDTHLHCFAGADEASFPYHQRAPYRPEAAATPEHLLQCMDGAGVDYAVVVHPEPYQDDHRYLKHCLSVGGSRLKGTCLFFADRPGFVEGLRSLVTTLPGQIVAARVHAYAPERLPPFGSEELRTLWKTAAELGLAMQLHFEPRYAPGFEPLIREFPETPVVIDHLGRPFQGTRQEHDVVLRWSRLPNTIMKIASVPWPTNYPHRDIRPVLRRLVDAYGPERMISGGGFNSEATPESYRRYRLQVGDLLSHLSDQDRAGVFGGTAFRLFGFESNGPTS
jgi:predicted TIM-barrel fold metal-dependent hydrolase